MDLPGEPSSLIIFSIIAIVAVGYFMYMNGVGYFRSMSAMWFYQTQGIFEDNIHASLKKTSGKATKVFRIKKSGFYDFNLNSELDSGNVTVSLIDSLGNKVFELNKMNGFSSDYLNESEKYRLVFSYNKASGKFELSWK
ncbi:hypothetical protein [uncultured Finegoldia sp.]|uniref:hypothetical protein n=1 Tax=uncultured Finegoldia sp. TaxID=328009 RepID=UPI00262E5CCC|nr:hypothetical protein [uncultured Finegoldia sp.]